MVRGAPPGAGAGRADGPVETTTPAVVVPLPELVKGRSSAAVVALVGVVGPAPTRKTPPTSRLTTTNKRITRCCILTSSDWRRRARSTQPPDRLPVPRHG